MQTDQKSVRRIAGWSIFYDASGQRLLTSRPRTPKNVRHQSSWPASCRRDAIQTSQQTGSGVTEVQ